MSGHRLQIKRDDMSFDERTENLMRDVRRRMDDDLQRLGFGRSRALGSIFTSPHTSDLWSKDHDFFQLRPSLGGGGGGGGRDSPSRRDDWGSRESLDDVTTKRLYRGGEAATSLQGSEGAVAAQTNGTGRVFSMNFDVKDYRYYISSLDST